jgi:hypothetical protein
MFSLPARQCRPPSSAVPVVQLRLVAMLGEARSRDRAKPSEGFRRNYRPQQNHGAKHQDEAAGVDISPISLGPLLPRYDAPAAACAAGMERANKIDSDERAQRKIEQDYRLRVGHGVPGEARTPECWRISGLRQPTGSASNSSPSATGCCMAWCSLSTSSSPSQRLTTKVATPLPIKFVSARHSLMNLSMPTRSARD